MSEGGPASQTCPNIARKQQLVCVRQGFPLEFSPTLVAPPGATCARGVRRATTASAAQDGCPHICLGMSRTAALCRPICAWGCLAAALRLAVSAAILATRLYACMATRANM